MPGYDSSLNNSWVTLPVELTLTVVPPFTPFNCSSKADSIPATPIRSVEASYPLNSYFSLFELLIGDKYPIAEEANYLYV